MLLACFRSYSITVLVDDKKELARFFITVLAGPPEPPPSLPPDS
jgi:hypothetical protein